MKPTYEEAMSAVNDMRRELPLTDEAQDECIIALMEMVVNLANDIDVTIAQMKRVIAGLSND